MAGKKRKNDGVEKFYAVKCGMIPGIYMTWAECQAQTSGYSGAICTCQHGSGPRPPLLLPLFVLVCARRRETDAGPGGC